MKLPHCKLTSRQRPGLVETFIQPTKLKNQVRAKAGKTPIKFTATGKTLVGGTQWTAQVMRPGLAAPSIVAKAAPPVVKAEVKPEEAAADLAKAAAKAAAGFGRYTY